MLVQVKPRTDRLFRVNGQACSPVLRSSCSLPRTAKLASAEEDENEDQEDARLKAGEFMTDSTRVAFSLIEMLAVIAVIVILAALLLPAIGKSQASAYRIRCIANLRQLGLAAQMYWDDNNGVCFRYGGVSTNGGQLYWFGWMGAGAEGERPFDAAQGVLYPYVRGRGVELCPAFTYFSPQIKLKASGASYGYGYNLYLSASPREPAVKTSQIARPANLLLLGDAAQVNTWQPPASSSRPMLEEWYYLSDDTNQPNGHFRHGQKANGVFCDGHAASERFVPGSIDSRMPQQWVGLFRKEILRTTGEH